MDTTPLTFLCSGLALCMEILSGKQKEQQQVYHTFLKSISKDKSKVWSGRRSYSWTGARWWWWEPGRWPSSLRSRQHCWRWAGLWLWWLLGDRSGGGWLDGQGRQQRSPIDAIRGQPVTALISPCSRWLGLICQEVTVVSSGCSCCSLLWNVLLWPPSWVCVKEKRRGHKGGAEQKSH